MRSIALICVCIIFAVVILECESARSSRSSSSSRDSGSSSSSSSSSRTSGSSSGSSASKPTRSDRSSSSGSSGSSSSRTTRTDRSSSGSSSSSGSRDAASKPESSRGSSSSSSSRSDSSSSSSRGGSSKPSRSSSSGSSGSSSSRKQSDKPTRGEKPEDKKTDEPEKPMKDRLKDGAKQAGSDLSQLLLETIIDNGISASFDYLIDQPTEEVNPDTGLSEVTCTVQQKTAFIRSAIEEVVCNSDVDPNDDDAVELVLAANSDWVEELVDFYCANQDVTPEATCPAAPDNDDADTDNDVEDFSDAATGCDDVRRAYFYGVAFEEVLCQSDVDPANAADVENLHLTDADYLLEFVDWLCEDPASDYAPDC